MNQRTIAYLAVKDNTADKSLTDFIELRHGNNTKINFITSPRVFSAVNGLADKMKQFENVGTVFAIQDNFKNEQFEAAAKTGIRFAIVFKNGSGEWEGFYIGLDRKKIPFVNRTKKAATATA